jgi:ABC-2 type transport system permease protein
MQLRPPPASRGVPRRHRGGRVNRRWLRLTAIVAEREIRQRGRSRAFAVSTIVLLLVVAAGVTIPAILAHHAKPQRVGIVGGPVASMTATVQEAGHLTGSSVTVIPEPSLATAEAALRSGQLDAVLVDNTEVVVKQVSIAGSSGSGGSLPGAIADVAGLSKLLGELPPGAAASGVTLPVRGLTPPSASLSRRLTGLFTVVLVWILISAYGSQIAMGVGEEKSNRIVEVILASVRPIQLLVGKVTGIGVLALAQAALMVATFLGLGAAVGSSLVHGAAPGIVITGAVFLVLGYAFYCTAYAAAGSLVSRQSDVGSVILPVQIPLIIAYALSYTVIYANGASTFYKVLGFLPPTAPVAMPVLYAAGDVPGWQAAISAVLVAVGTVWMARTAATIYGRSILRTGSRVRLREVLGRAPVS